MTHPSSILANGINRIHNDPHKERQMIPVLTETAIQHLLLFEVFRAAGAFDLSLLEKHAPGVAATLLAWAESHKLVVTERQFLNADGETGYVNRSVSLALSQTITVLAFRELTAVEVIRLRDAAADKTGAAQYAAGQAESQETP